MREGRDKKTPPYDRKPANKCRKNDRIRKSLFDIYYNI